MPRIGIFFVWLLMLTTALASYKIYAEDQTAENSAVDNIKPQRIVSLSLCTDQVLLMLVEPERIQALSHLANNPAYSFMHEKAQGHSFHHGFAEEIIPLNPDLIIGSIYGKGNTNAMLNSLGYQVEKMRAPTTLAEIERFTREIANLVGEPERGEMVIASMYEKINEAKSLVKDKPKSIAISYGPNGFTAGEKTMKNTILEAAGLENLASILGIEYYGNLSVEQLLAANPDSIIVDESIENQNSLAQNYVNHPVLKHLYQGKKLLTVTTNQWLCPGPTAGDAILSLAEQR